MGKRKKKWAKELNRYFFKKDTQIFKKYMKIFSVSLGIMEMQIKTTRHHFSLGWL